MSHPHPKPIIGITTGDLNGIGIELIIKSLSEHQLLEFFTPVIFAFIKTYLAKLIYNILAPKI
jgi:4-hydroxythreonine-4-phosphate dehydrogenase